MRLTGRVSVAVIVFLAGLAFPVILGAVGVSAASAPVRAAIVSVPTPACGKIEFPSSATSTSPSANWVIPGGGVPVHSNGPDEGTTSDCSTASSTVNGQDVGEEWQCVELINRLYLSRGWISPPSSKDKAPWPGSAGPAFYNNAPSNLVKQRNGSVPYLGPGDVVIINVFYKGKADGGHALVVNDTSDMHSGPVSLVSQNSGLGGNSEPVVTGTIANGSVTVGGGGNGYTYSVYGVVHSPLAWNAVPISLPAGTSDVHTPLVTCPSPTACVSVINYVNSSGISHGLLAWGYGSSWQTHPVPLPPGAAAAQPVFLGSLACSSASACVVAGLYTTTSGHAAGMLVSGSGSTWHAIDVPVLGDGVSGSGGVTGVACDSSGQCLVIGSYTTTQGATPPMLLWGYGTKWAPRAVDLPEDASLYSVSCAPGGTCAAYGAYDSGGQIQDVLLTGQGSVLSPFDVSLPPGAAAVEPGTQLACASPGHCLAVVNYSPGGASGNLFELLSGYGATWTTVKLPVPANGKAGSASPDAVACGSASQCLAVGTYSVSGTNEGLLESWNGSAWKPAEAQLPAAGATSAALTWAGCAPSGLCAAAGYYLSSSDGYRDLLLSGYGTALAPAMAPGPFGNYPDIDSVSCSSSSSLSACAMAGAADGADKDALLWHWG